MRAFRFSILGLMVLVALLGLGMAALRRPSVLWDSALLTATIGLLLTALIALPLTQGSTRAFWIGFAICGWGYVIVTLEGGRRAEVIRPRLFTERGIEELYFKLGGLSPGLIFRQGVITFNPYLDQERILAHVPPSDENAESQVEYAQFARTAHTLFTLILASLAGFTAHLYALRRRAEPAESTNAATVTAGHAQPRGEPGSPLMPQEPPL